MLFRVIIVCLVLSGAYALYEIYAISRYYEAMRNPEETFLIKGAPNDRKNDQKVALVEFINYANASSKETHRALMELVDISPDIMYVARPTTFANPKSTELAKLALAAGLQGKFWEMSEAILSYDGTPDERFIRETAALYDLDAQKLLDDAKGETVQKMADNNANAALRTGVDRVPAFLLGHTFYTPETTPGIAELIRMLQKEKNKP